MIVNIQALAAVWGSKGHQHQDRLCDINDALGPSDLFVLQRRVAWGRMCEKHLEGLGRRSQDVLSTLRAWKPGLVWILASH